MFLSQARLNFKLRAKMAPTVQMNFMSDPKFASNLCACVCCESISQSGKMIRNMDSQTHILYCSGYADLRVEKNLSNDKDLVEYFSSVIKRRQEETCLYENLCVYNIILQAHVQGKVGRDSYYHCAHQGVSKTSFCKLFQINK